MKIALLTKKMIIIIAALGAAMMLGGAVSTMFHRLFLALPFVVGVLLTTGLNVLKIVMIEGTARKATSFGPDEGLASKNFIRTRYILRFFLTGAVLFVAAITPNTVIDLWGAIAGIFTLPLATFIVQFFNPHEEAAKNE